MQHAAPEAVAWVVCTSADVCIPRRSLQQQGTLTGEDTVAISAQLHPTLPFAYYATQLAIQTAGSHTVTASIGVTPIRSSPLTLSIQPAGPVAASSFLSVLATPADSGQTADTESS